MKSSRKLPDGKAPPAKKSRTRDDRDRTFNPARDSNNKRKASITDGQNIVAVRSKHDTEFVDENGKIVEIKHCALVAVDVVKRGRFNRDEFGKRFTTALQGKLSEVAEVVEFSATGTPVKAVTPRGTKVRAIVNAGDYVVLSNDPSAVPVAEQKVVTTLPNDAAFFKSKEYAALEEATQAVKRQEALITKTLLAKSKAAHDKGGKVRPVSQNRTMAKAGVAEEEGRVNPYVEAAVVFSMDFSWEWFHHVAYRVLHMQAQDPDNLSAATSGANTLAAIWESYYPLFASKYPEGFKLSITSEMVTSEDGNKKTHIGVKHHYSITTKDWNLKLNLNAQHPGDPHYACKIVFEALVNSLLTTSKIASTPPSTPSKALLPPTPGTPSKMTPPPTPSAITKAITSPPPNLPFFRRVRPTPVNTADPSDAPVNRVLKF